MTHSRSKQYFLNTGRSLCEQESVICLLSVVLLLLVACGCGKTENIETEYQKYVALLDRQDVAANERRSNWEKQKAVETLSRFANGVDTAIAEKAKIRLAIYHSMTSGMNSAAVGEEFHGLAETLQTDWLRGLAGITYVRYLYANNRRDEAYTYTKKRITSGDFDQVFLTADSEALPLRQLVGLQTGARGHSQFAQAVVEMLAAENDVELAVSYGKRVLDNYGDTIATSAIRRTIIALTDDTYAVSRPARLGPQKYD